MRPERAREPSHAPSFARALDATDKRVYCDECHVERNIREQPNLATIKYKIGNAANTFAYLSTREYLTMRTLFSCVRARAFFNFTNTPLHFRAKREDIHDGSVILSRSCTKFTTIFISF